MINYKEVLRRIDLEASEFKGGVVLGEVKTTINPVTQAIAEYRLHLPTRELVTQTHRVIWQARGELVGVAYEVTACPFSAKELTQRKEKGIRVGFLPRGLEAQKSRHKLGEMYPGMRSFSVQKGNPITNDKNSGGWFDYEEAIDAPYLDTNEEQLLKKLAKDGRKLLNVNQYVVATQDSILFVGHYLDETRTYTRLSSRKNGHLVRVGCRPNGRLDVYSNLQTGAHGPGLGGRSSGV
jgi:hypothetical protein